MSPLHFGVSGEGRSLPNPESNAASPCCTFCMIPVQHNALPLVFQGFSPALKSDGSLVEAVGSSCFVIIALGSCSGPTETSGVLSINGSLFH